MLSFVKSSDPSSSSFKIPTLKANERDFVQLESQEADPGFDEAQSPNFSIRDYVFASRNKNIQTGWPFPLPLLQLFLNHGIWNSLPPFEPSSSLRVHCRRPVDSCFPLQGVVLSCSDEAEEELRQSVKLTDGESGLTVTTRCDIGKVLAWMSEPVKKKGRLILKSRVISEPRRAEEMASVSSTVSDPMASNVCPVCKTFSSTSNTTLNAHMDQCLFMESDINQFGDNAQNLKVKPRKKRFMEDIYVTALHCTLEDLDRRNGRIWASDSVLVTHNTETTKVAKSHTFSQVDTSDDKNEGEVYVDPNGIKLRILSKFSNTPMVLSKEEFRRRKIVESFGDRKFISINKKKHMGAIHSEKKKFNLKNKKPNFLKLFKDEIHATDKVIPKESHPKEQESHIQLSGEQGHISSCGTATLKRWSCSKRSDLPRKFNNKGFHKNLEHPKPVSGMQRPDNKKQTPSSFAQKQDVKLSQSPESILVQSVDNVVQNKDDQNSTKLFSLEGTSSKVLLKHSRSFQRSMSEDSCIVNRQMFSRSTETNKLLKTKRLSTLSMENSMNKILCKNRSLHRTSKRKRDLFSDDNSRLQKPVEAAIMGFPAEVVNEQCLHLESSLHQDVNPVRSEVVDVSSFLPELEYEGVVSESVSAQDSSACLTSHGDMRPDNASGPSVPNVNNNFSIKRKISGSPASSSSTITPSSPKDSHTTVFDAEILSKPYITHDKVILDIDLVSNKQAQMDSIVMQKEQLSDYHSFCCSRQSIMTCLGSREDTVTTPVLESPKASIFTRDCSDFGSLSSSSGTPTQSSNSSVLRLMGKNLMVMNTQESSQQTNIHSSTPDNNSNAVSKHQRCSDVIYTTPVPQVENMPVLNGLFFAQIRKMNQKSCMSKEVILAKDSPYEDVGSRRTSPWVSDQQPMLPRPIPYLLPQSELVGGDIGLRSSCLIKRGSS